MTLLSGCNIPDADWEVVGDSLAIGARRCRMSEFKIHRAARLKLIDEDIDKLALKMDQLNFKSKLKDRLNVKLITRKFNTDSTPVPCSTCDSTMIKKKQCKLCDAIICPACSKYVGYYEAKFALLSSSRPVYTKTERHSKKLRLCAKCDHLIELRRPQTHECDSTLISLHDEMKDLVDSSRSIKEIFCTINQSLLVGETTYQLSDLKILRERLSKTAQVIVVLSQKIAVLPATPGSRHAKLRDYIKMAAVLYIKEHLLPVHMPSELQIEEVKQKRFTFLNPKRKKKIKYKKIKPSSTGHGKTLDVGNSGPNIMEIIGGGLTPAVDAFRLID